jgi:hypothetical protein
LKSRALIAWIAFAVMAVVLCPAISPAMTLTGESNTYLQFREATNDTRLAPLYEYLNFSLDSVGDDKVSFHYGGWGKVDLADESYVRRVDSDLQYAYISFKNDKNNTTINFGRVFVTEGVAAEKVDGFYARTDLKGGFGISAYGGHPVEEVLNGTPGDLIYGGRLSYQIPAYLVMGVSYLKENGGSDSREEAGVDIWLRPVKNIEVTGKSSYNAITDGWMEHSYHLMLGPFANFKFNTEASWISYKDYFTAATTPVFNFLPGVLDPAEKLRILGEEVSYPVYENVTLSVDYKNYGYDIQGDANYCGMKLAYAVPGSGGAGLSVSRMDGQTDTLRYDEFRVYGYKKFGKTDLTLDLLDIDYDQPVSGVRNAYSTTFAVGYALTEKVRVVADVDYSHNPVYSSDLRTMLHLVCRFDTTSGGGK